MSLVDDALLSLDDHVSDYISSFTGTKAGITLRQLMSHTSGLPGKSRYHVDKTLTLEQAVDSIAVKVPLQASPGSAFRYGGVSMQVAGRIAEVVAGAPWDTIWSERIARKLGMQNTDYNGLGETDNPQIAGGAQTTARDYILFLRMLMNDGASEGREILSPSAVSAILSDQTGGADIQATPYSGFEYLQTGISQRRYGIGNWIEREDESGSTPEAFGSQGAFGFSPWFAELIYVYRFCRSNDSNTIPEIPDTSLIFLPLFQHPETLFLRGWIPAGSGLHSERIIRRSFGGKIHNRGGVRLPW